MQSRLREIYEKEIVPELVKEFGYKNTFAVPKLTKIVLNMGVGEAKENAKLLEYAFETAAIAGKADDWRYIDGIMARLLARDIHTPEAARQWDEDRPDIDEGA